MPGHLSCRLCPHLISKAPHLIRRRLPPMSKADDAQHLKLHAQVSTRTAFPFLNAHVPGSFLSSSVIRNSQGLRGYRSLDQVKVSDIWREGLICNPSSSTVICTDATRAPRALSSRGAPGAEDFWDIAKEREMHMLAQWFPHPGALLGSLPAWPASASGDPQSKT